MQKIRDWYIHIHRFVHECIRAHTHTHTHTYRILDFITTISSGNIQVEKPLTLIWRCPVRISAVIPPILIQVVRFCQSLDTNSRIVKQSNHNCTLSSSSLSSFTEHPNVRLLTIWLHRSQWLCHLRLKYAAARLLELQVRIPPGACMSVSCKCCVFSASNICIGLITGCGVSTWKYRKASIIRRSWSTRACCVVGKILTFNSKEACLITITNVSQNKSFSCGSLHPSVVCYVK
jgi:hypothetical protein